MALAAVLTMLLPAAGRAQVIINEILAANGGSIAPLAEITDYFPEYIELYNAGITNIDLGSDGWTITDNPNVTNKFQFPPGTMIYADSFLLLFCDSETNFPGIHVGFSLDAKTGEDISLFKRSGANYVRVTHTTFGIQVPGYSVGRLPGANADAEFTLNFPTPCGGTVPCLANTPAPFVPPPFTSNQFTLKINEWLATNSAGPHEDWLEIYNPDTNIVELSYLVIWDKPESLFSPPDLQHNEGGPKPVPALSYIAPLGYVQFFCSGDIRSAANNLNFSISSGTGNGPSASGILDTLYLHAPPPSRATIIDVVQSRLFQARNISEGRVPDGSSRIGVFPNPTPGEANFGPIPEININEVLSHTDPPLEDAVEFQNVSTNVVDMSYWWMSNRRNHPKLYQFPPGTLVQTGAFLVVYEHEFNGPQVPVERRFTFNSARGDECYIFKAGTNGDLLGYRKGVSFGAAANGYSFGRYVTSDTNVEFVALSDLSFGTFVRAGMATNLLDFFRTGRGESNAPIRMSPVVINEIHYHPIEFDGIGGTNDDSLHEFIELRNVASTNVPLYYNAQVSSGENPAFLTNRWKIRGNVDYEFPKTSFPVLAASNYLL
ncbi:MAG TPA: lamin tail domain-containing protein, partial [Verrucomicrobiae bacterium]|nr:lamin tail domain-containing protein [Verrucomicrobiae bacterium]